MNLGVKQKSPEAITSAQHEEKVHYPSFDVREEIADKLRKEHKLTVGTEGTATIHWCVSGDSKDNYSNRVTLEVKSLDGVKVSSGEKAEDEEADEKPEKPTEEDSDQEKILGYKRPKSAAPAHEAPDTSAKSLMD